MKGFDDENSAWLESFLQDVRGSAASYITKQYQIPAALSKIELLCLLNLCLEIQAQFQSRLAGNGHRFFGRVETSYIPSLLRQPDTVAPLAHTDIKSSSRFAGLDHLHQECIRFGVKARLLRCQDP